MTNNEPLGGNLNDDVNANGTASSAAHPVDAADLRDSGGTTGQYDDVDIAGNGAGGNGAPHVDRADAGTDAFGAGTAGVGDGTTGLTTGATGAGGVGSGATGLGSGSGSSGSSSAGTGGSNLGDLGDPAHPFDQTNGIVEGLEGDSDEADAGDSTPV